MRTTDQRRRAALAGALGGVAGGVAMTVLMTQVAPRAVPKGVLPDPPAPVKTVRWAERQVDRPQALSGKSEQAAAMASHLAYSAVTGAGYGLARSSIPAVRQVPTPAAGALFGLFVWAASFQGLLPALGVKEATTQHPPKRWPAPLMGHTLFGVVTAAVAAKVDRGLA
jgi:uncharacterized membrane protein YagU involved in acid resistance